MDFFKTFKMRLNSLSANTLEGNEYDTGKEAFKSGIEIILCHLN